MGTAINQKLQFWDNFWTWITCKCCVNSDGKF